MLEAQKLVLNSNVIRRTLIGFETSAATLECDKK